MPIYEYECAGCQRQFERLHRTDSPVGSCPFCGHENLHRLMSLCGVSSEASRAASLSAAHQRAAAKRNEKQRAEHAQHHDHFGDSVQG